jgi:hypothetical protein
MNGIRKRWNCIGVAGRGGQRYCTAPENPGIGIGGMDCA